MRNFNFSRLLPIVMPFAVYGYVRLFFAVVRIDVEPDAGAFLAGLALLIGPLGGIFVMNGLNEKGVQWKWLARKEKSDD